MGFASRGITSAEILAAIVDDSTRYHGASIAAILTDTAAINNRKGFFIMDMWGMPVSGFAISTGIGDKTLGDVDIPSFAGMNVTLYAAYAMMRISSVRDSSAANNHLNITSLVEVDKSAAGWITGIGILQNAIEVLADAREPSDITFMGEIDIISRVALGQTTNFRWYQVRSLGSDLVINGCQTGVRLVGYT